MSNCWIETSDGHVKPCDDILKWGRWMENAQRVVGNFIIDGIRVSTVFLGTDYNFARSGAPILYETMIFGGPRDQETHRYTTRQEAQKGHIAVCESLSNKEG